MYWINYTDNPDRLLRREKTFPPPADTPELGFRDWDTDRIWIGGEPGELDVNFCYNSMCGNFGLSHTLAAARGKPYTVRRKGNQLSLICPECGLNRKIYNNEAVDKMFLHVLKNNLLHEHCGNEQCYNYRVNLHEYYGEVYEAVKEVPTDTDELKNYRYQVICSNCSKRFSAGVPWRIHDKQENESPSGKVRGRPFPISTQVFMKLVCNGIGPSAIIELTDSNAGDYYALLHNLARTCSAMSGRYLMDLQSARYAQRVNESKDDNTMRLYSDMMEISILLDDRDKRVLRLPCLVTVTDYRGSFFALAATPMFMPMTLSREKMKSFRARLRHESLYLESHQPHAHLLSDEALRDYEEQPGNRKYTYPILGLGGYFVHTGYGALAHFLTLRKMLSRIRRVVHYVDNESPLEMSTLTAFADRIQDGLCDVVAVRIDQQKKLTRNKKSPPEDKKDNGQDPEDNEATLDEEEDDEQEDGNDTDDSALSKHNKARKKQMLELISKIPASLADATARQAAIRQAGEARDEARDVIDHVIGAFELPPDIFAEKRRRHYARKLATLPVEITRGARALDKRINEAAALTKEVAALAGDVDKLTEETHALTGDTDRLAEETARHTEPEFERRVKSQGANDEAYVYRLAVNKTVRESGLDLWVRDEKGPGFEPNRRFLWLTRRRTPPLDLSKKEIRQQYEKEVELYLYGKHQPVDTYMSSLRQLASTAERARLVASTSYGAGYVSSPRMPTSILSELVLHRFRWNFMRRRREKKRYRNKSRALKLGLDVTGPLTVNNVSTVRTKVFEWAQKITNNLRGIEDGEGRV